MFEICIQQFNILTYMSIQYKYIHFLNNDPNIFTHVLQINKENIFAHTVYTFYIYLDLLNLSICINNKSS